jgi:hypothetical protein
MIGFIFGLAVGIAVTWTVAGYLCFQKGYDACIEDMEKDGYFN